MKKIGKEDEEKGVKEWKKEKRRVKIREKWKMRIIKMSRNKMV